jgi:hypothetical protein
LKSAWLLGDRLRPAQAAAVLGIAPRTLRTLREQGIVVGELTSGGQWTYDRAEIEALSRRRQGGNEVQRDSSSPDPATTRNSRDFDLSQLRDRVRRFASRVTTTDRRFPPEHPTSVLCEASDQDPCYWRWDTQSSDECFRLAMRRVEARLSSDAVLPELMEIVKQTVRDYIWDSIDERGGFCVEIEIDASIPQKEPGS